MAAPLIASDSTVAVNAEALAEVCTSAAILHAKINLLDDEVARLRHQKPFPHDQKGP